VVCVRPLAKVPFLPEKKLVLSPYELLLITSPQSMVNECKQTFCKLEVKGQVTLAGVHSDHLGAMDGLAERLRAGTRGFAPPPPQQHPDEREKFKFSARLPTRRAAAPAFVFDSSAIAEV